MLNITILLNPDSVVVLVIRCSLSKPVQTFMEAWYSLTKPYTQFLTQTEQMISSHGVLLS